MKPDLHAKDRIKLAGEQVSDIFIREVNLVCSLSEARERVYNETIC